jgi:hypothetical protein
LKRNEKIVVIPKRLIKERMGEVKKEDVMNIKKKLKS